MTIYTLPPTPPISNSSSLAGASRIYATINRCLFGNSDDYTTNNLSNTNRKHLFAQSPDYTDNPTFQPVIEVLTEIATPAPTRAAARDGGVS